MITKFKLFEEFVTEDHAVCINFKTEDGEIITLSPIFAVTSKTWKPGYPPLVHMKNKDEYTTEDKKFLKLAGYLETEFYRITKKREHNSYAFLNGIVEYLEDTGFECKESNWGTIDEHVFLFNNKEEIDKFLGVVQDFMNQNK